MAANPSRSVLQSYGRALRAQFTGKMLLLSFIPCMLALVLWGGILYAGFQPLLDWMHAQFVEHDLFSTSGGWLAAFGLGALKTILVPLIAMLLLLPLMILTALLFMGLFAMPAIVKYVSAKQFPTLEMKQGGSLLGSMLANLTGFGIFALLWLLSLPLYALAPLALLAQVLLWGWLTARVMAYDALAEHASADERAAITRQHRLPLQAIGMISGALGALPGIVWVGGTVLSFVLFPFLAIISLWMYVTIFIFTGLWFQYYCLQALEDLRAGEKAPIVAH